MEFTLESPSQGDQNAVLESGASEDPAGPLAYTIPQADDDAAAAVEVGSDPLLSPRRPESAPGPALTSGGDRGDSDDAELLGGGAADAVPPAVWAAAAGATASSRLLLRLLNSEEPALSQPLVDHLLLDDSHLGALLNFVTRPIDARMHAGAAWVGQFAVDAEGAAVYPAVTHATADAATAATTPSRAAAGDVASDSDTPSSAGAATRWAVSGGQLDAVSLATPGERLDGAAGASPVAHLRADAAEQRFSSYAILRAPSSGRDAATVGGEKEAAQHSLMMAGGAAAGGAGSDDDSDSVVSGTGAFGEQNHHAQPHVGRGGGPGAAHAMPGAVIAVHAASFAAAVAHVRHSAAAAAQSWRLRGSLRAPVYDATGSVADPGSARALDGPEPSALRPVSALFPRQGEEVDALAALQRAAHDSGAADADAGAAAADAALAHLSDGVAALKLSEAAAAAAVGCPSPGSAAGRSPSRLSLIHI